MKKRDASFAPSLDQLAQASSLLQAGTDAFPKERIDLPAQCPEIGLGESETLTRLAPYVLGQAARLDDPQALAHMDPPTPWITWATALWNARLNQNLLHPATAPFALAAEKRVIDWLTPFFGMDGGHFCSGSTLANLTALWAARDAGQVKQVMASKAAHLSIKKAAAILGLPYLEIETDRAGQLDPNALRDCCSVHGGHGQDKALAETCLVLTAGTTTTGAIDPLTLAGQAKWTHVDAAWAGPLRLSPVHAHRLAGIEGADSVAISGHKWFFQPKDSAMVLFRESARVNPAISFGSGYLAVPNVGVQGSRGAAAIGLLATLLAWGRAGIADRIDHCMAMADQLAQAVSETTGLVLWGQPTTGVTLFRPLESKVAAFQARLLPNLFSNCQVDDQEWIRSVAANPMADIDQIIKQVQQVSG